MGTQPASGLPSPHYTPSSTKQGHSPMRYLHTMVRVKDLDQALHFYCKLFGLQEIRRYENEKGRFTLVFLAPRAMSTAPRMKPRPAWNSPIIGIPRNIPAGGTSATSPTGRRYLRILQASDGQRRDDQSSAARRPHGLRPLAGRHLDRDPAERRTPGGPGTLGFDGQYGGLVSLAQLPLANRQPSPALPSGAALAGARGSIEQRMIFRPGYCRAFAYILRS